MSEDDTSSIPERKRQIATRIARACEEAGRRSEDVTLIGVCKRQSAARIDAALGAGLRDFGENRVQEARSHWQACDAARPVLHLVGSLQSNKASDAIALFDVIHSLDRESLARALRDGELRSGLKRRYFIQVNTGDEAQKSGCAIADVADFHAFCREECGLDVIGLMCLPPVEEEPALHFALLADHAARLGLSGLSMGMSEDFETAIRYGATHIRVGTLLFGPRED